MNKDSFLIHGIFIYLKHLRAVISRGEVLVRTPRASFRPNDSRWRFPSFSIFLLFAAMMLGNAALTHADAKSGDLFPQLAAFGLEGQVPETKGKVMLVDFFASWCAPCQKSFPVMEELHKEYSGKGLVIVAISLDKKKADLDRFLKKHPTSFNILRDANGKLAGELKLPTMPTSYLVGKDGKITSVHSGFHGEETRKRYVSEIQALLE